MCSLICLLLEAGVAVLFFNISKKVEFDHSLCSMSPPSDSITVLCMKGLLSNRRITQRDEFLLVNVSGVGNDSMTW